MDPIEALRPLLTALLAELQRQQPAIYDAGREMAVRLWDTLRSDDPNASAELPDPTGGGPLKDLWAGVAGPFAQGLSDELEERVKALVAPTVKKVALASGAAGIFAGWTAKGMMSR